MLKPSFLIGFLVVFLFAILAVGSNTSSAKPAVEIIPIAVWKGEPEPSVMGSMLDELRLGWPDPRMAHAVSAAPLARGDNSRQRYLEQLGSILQSGDDILLHMAPWRSLSEKASASRKDGPTLFGVKIQEESCAVDCGLDLSFTAFTDSEIQGMIAISKKLLFENGLGNPGAVYFEEGVTADSLHFAARQQGIHQDWSGIEMGQMKASLGRFPVYQFNRDYVSRLPLVDISKEQTDGVLLDHIRYGIHAEIADLESTIEIFKLALNESKKSGRLIRIPIMFNVDDLYFTREFVRDAVIRAREVALSAGVDVVPWTPQNITWTFGRKSPPAKEPSLVIATQVVENNGTEAEFIPQDEVELEFSGELESTAH